MQPQLASVFAASLCALLLAAAVSFGLRTEKRRAASTVLAMASGAVIAAGGLAKWLDLAEAVPITVAWPAVMAASALGSLRLPRTASSSMYTGTLASMAAVACSTAFAIWVLKPGTGSAVWAGLIWLFAALVASPLASLRDSLPKRLAAGRRATYRVYLAPDDSEVHNGFAIELSAPTSVSLREETLVLTVALGMTCAGVGVIGLTKADSGLVFLLPIWTIGLTAAANRALSRWTGRRLLPASNRIAYCLALASVFTHICTMSTPVDAFAGGILLFAIQASIAAAAVYAVRAPMEAVAPAALAMLGFPGPAAVVGILRGEPAMAGVMGWLAPAVVLLGALLL